MLPVFKPGGVVFAVPGRLRRGDCAVYSYEGRTLLHRVLRVSPEGAWLGDDAGRLEPHFVPWRSVKGKAVSRNPAASGLFGFAYSSLRRSFSAILHA